MTREIPFIYVVLVFAGVLFLTNSMCSDLASILGGILSLDLLGNSAAGWFVANTATAVSIASAAAPVNP